MVPDSVTRAVKRISGCAGVPIPWTGLASTGRKKGKDGVAIADQGGWARHSRLDARLQAARGRLGGQRLRLLHLTPVEQGCRVGDTDPLCMQRRDTCPQRRKRLSGLPFAERSR